MTKPVVYIAGPMTGIAEFNAPAFFCAESFLEGWGYDVRNPAQHDIDSGFNPYGTLGTETPEETGFNLEEAMRWDLEQVRNADLVVVLPGHENSKGTSLEIFEALKFGTPIIYLDEILPEAERLTTRFIAYHNKRIASAALPCLTHYQHETIRMLKTKPLYATLSVKDTELINAVKAPYAQGGYVSTMGIASKVALEQQQEAEAKVLAADPTTNSWIDFGNKVAENQWTGDKGEVRTVSSTGGEKGTKLARYDLLPVDALRQIAEHYGRGAEKYDSNQWRKGYEWSKSFAALMRHAQQFWGGEDFDEETGSNHMAAVAWHALTLLTFYDDYPDFDDRYKGEDDAS